MTLITVSEATKRKNEKSKKGRIEEKREDRTCPEGIYKFLIFRK